MPVKIFLCISLFATTIIAQIKNEKNFYKYFQKTGEIELSEEIVISEIAQLDYSGNQFLVTDILGKQVVLFNAKTGELNRILDVEKTHPGFNWRPTGAYFNKDEIFVANAGPWGYRFDKEGNGKGDMSNKFLGTEYCCFQSNGNIVGFYCSNTAYLSLMNNRGDEIKRYGKFSFEFPNMTHRFSGSGVIRDENDNVYLITSADWLIYKYDKNLNFIKTINTKPSYYRKIDHDLKSKDHLEARSEYKNLLKDKSTNMNMYLLSKGKILVQYYAPFMKKTPIGISIIDTEGKKLLAEDILLSTTIILAKENKVFIYVQPKWDQDKQPGPVIEIYELKNNSLKK